MNATHRQNQLRKRKARLLRKAKTKEGLTERQRNRLQELN
jgi:hypothetical protein